MKEFNQSLQTYYIPKDREEEDVIIKKIFNKDRKFNMNDI